MTKKIINVRVGDPVISKYNSGREYIRITNCRSVYFHGVENLINNLQEIVKEYSEYTDLTLEPARDCGCYSLDCGCTPTYYVHGNRLETDLEYNFRLREEQERNEAREAQERAEYLKLKAKFEDS